MRKIILFMVALVGCSTDSAQVNGDATENALVVNDDLWRVVLQGEGDDAVAETTSLDECGDRTWGGGCCTYLHHAEPEATGLAMVLADIFPGTTEQSLGLNSGERAVLAWVAVCGHPGSTLMPTSGALDSGTLTIDWTLTSSCGGTVTPARPQAILAIDATISAVEHTMTVDPCDEQ